MNDEKFWEIITKIDWTSAIDSEKSMETEDAVETARKRYLKTVEDIEERIQFEKMFRRYNSKINAETMRRIKHDEAIFTPNINHRSDDYLFIDLPAHLIGKGKYIVQEYLNGKVVEESPVESLIYIFQSDEAEQ